MFEHFWPKNSEQFDESSRRAQAGKANVGSQMCEILVAIESKLKEK